VLDVKALTLTGPHGSVEVTKLQTRILQALMEAKGRPLTREEILQRAFDHPSDCSDRNVDAHIKNLRRKIAPAGVSIGTTFGVGYRIDREAPEAV
jgi:DNA-binding response OmpR family regulator